MSFDRVKRREFITPLGGAAAACAASAAGLIYRSRSTASHRINNGSARAVFRGTLPRIRFALDSIRVAFLAHVPIGRPLREMRCRRPWGRLLPSSASRRPRFPVAALDSLPRIRTSERPSIASILGPIDILTLCSTLLRWLRSTPANFDQEVILPAFSILSRRINRTSFRLMMAGLVGSLPAETRRTRTRFNFSASQMLDDGNRCPFSTLLRAGRCIPVWRAHSDWLPTRSISRRSNSSTSSTVKICIVAAAEQSSGVSCRDGDLHARSMLVSMVGAEGQDEAVA